MSGKPAKSAARGTPKILQISCVYQWFRRCFNPTERQDVHMCELGGAMPPLLRSSWRDVMNDYMSCTSGFVRGSYIEMQLSYDFRARLHPFFDGFDLPESFALCYHRHMCTSTEVVELLLPLTWLTSLRRQQGQGISLNDLFMLDPLATEFMSGTYSSVGKQRVVEGGELLEKVYGNARIEALMSLPSDQQTANVSGAFCIVGQPRTFNVAQVYKSIQQNLISSLNFTETVIIYIMDLSFSENASYKTPRVLWEDFAKPFTLMPPTVLVTEAVSFEGHHPNGTCPGEWPLGCNPQFKSLEMCMDQVRSLEHSRGTEFEWIIRLRPDMAMLFPLGDIRTYDGSMLHVVYPSFGGLWDGFALIPRQHAETYFNARQFGATSHCWLEHDMPQPVLFDLCCTRLLLHLQAHKIPIARTFPVEMYTHGVVRAVSYYSHIKATGRDDAAFPLQASWELRFFEQGAPSTIARTKSWSPN